MRREKGATLVGVTAALLAVIGFAAVLIDLGFMRSARQAARLTVDAAAAAGAAELDGGSGLDACEASLAYAELNLDIDFTADCSSFPSTACDGDTVATTVTAASGDWAVAITYPVDDDDPLMDPAAIGGSTQAPTEQDGERCDRIGVRVTNNHRYFFGGIFGSSGGATEVHAVARGGVPSTVELVR